MPAKFYLHACEMALKRMSDVNYAYLAELLMFPLILRLTVVTKASVAEDLPILFTL